MPEPLLVLVAGDTEPPLDLLLVRRGQPIDVTGAVAAVARVEREGLDPLERPLVVVDGPTGRVRLNWLEGDLAVPEGTAAGETVDYRLEATVDGATNAVPYRFTVRPRLAAP